MKKTLFIFISLMTYVNGMELLDAGGIIDEPAKNKIMQKIAVTYEDELLSLASGPIDPVDEFDRIQFVINTQFKPILDEFERGLPVWRVFHAALCSEKKSRLKTREKKSGKLTDIEAYWQRFSIHSMSTFKKEMLPHILSLERKNALEDELLQDPWQDVG